MKKSELKSIIMECIEEYTNPPKRQGIVIDGPKRLLDRGLDWKKGNTIKKKIDEPKKPKWGKK